MKLTEMLDYMSEALKLILEDGDTEEAIRILKSVAKEVE